MDKKHDIFDGFTVNLFFDEDGDYLAHFVELPNVSAFGPTRAKALAELKSAWDLMKECYEEDGVPVPKAPSRSLNAKHESSRDTKNLRADTNLSKQPLHLPPCNPNARDFPITWKESYFRRNWNESRGGYVCPDCKQVFSGPTGFRQLDADCLIPRLRGGLTVWENLILRCKPCKVAKSSKTPRSHSEPV